MSAVKLSGKPEGATHYAIYNGGVNWYKLDGKAWLFRFNGGWHQLDSPAPQRDVIEIIEYPHSVTDERAQSKAREKACDHMFGIMLKVARPGNRSDMAEALYDAGYRKIETTGE